MAKPLTNVIVEVELITATRQ